MDEQAAADQQTAKQTPLCPRNRADLPEGGKPQGHDESHDSTSKSLLAVMTLVGALIGGIGSETIHYLSSKWLRSEESRSKARDMAVSQTEQTFRQLHGLRVKLRADINTYREMYLRAEYYGAREKVENKQRNHDHELFYRHMVETYTARIIDDRSQLQATLGWIEYVLPSNSDPLRKAADDLLTLRAWDPPDTPSARSTLDSWLTISIAAARKATREELEPKFENLRLLLHERRSELIREAAARYHEDIKGL